VAAALGHVAAELCLSGRWPVQIAGKHFPSFCSKIRNKKAGLIFGEAIHPQAAYKLLFRHLL
jgi:hypothetical protein